jgi:hypothetical protein
MSRESRREHNPVGASSEEAAALASSLAPLEEQESGFKKHPNGKILLDTSELKLPKDLLEEDKNGRGFGLEPVVIFILAVVLAFIGLIAYLISIEPAP